ncbi:neural cell adhesion molecule 1 [Eurytemora carolleeae]|uniref:neural cell adhesion molecule 1 n=1 Tax=Eurytemora carolleeae TaxID=1294199 RepID=UPI000C76EC3B|nr:neural cell adhesion molecule 1 [Eurytemora carolleeae]|eukprot:XP_023324649.1 neural cell adhesion molecule 1-like [Eurytemora affinis]
MNAFFIILCGLVCCVSGLVLQPEDRLVIQQSGETSFFVSCRGMNGLERDVLWRTEKGRISAATGDRVHLEPSVGGGIDLVFRSIEQDDQGRYTCSQGEDTKFFDLVVVQPLDFNDTPPVQMVQLGNPNFRLKCRATGLPFPTITWKVKGKSIRNSFDNLNQDLKYEMDGTDLLIRNIEKSDEGRYLCKAVQTVYDENNSVLYSDFRDNIIDLRIEQSPEWLDENSGGQFYGYVTGTANLTCQAEAEPPPTFSWLDAQNLPVKHGTVVNSEYKSTLLLEVTHHNIFGAYTCIAENLHGRLEKVVMLSEGAKPGTPQIKPNRIFGDSIQLNIVKPAAELFLHIEGFQVEIKQADKPWSEASVLQFNLGNDDVFIIPGLDQQTFYHVRARSRNKAGLSDPSNIIYLKTNGEIPYQAKIGQPSPAGSIHCEIYLLSLAALVLTLSW